MSRLNKRALYQMATRNSTPTGSLSPTATDSTGGRGEMVVEAVYLNPLSSTSGVPDGRVSGKLTGSVMSAIKANDAISVSHRATRNSGNSSLAVKRSEVLQKLGTGSLGLLTNAYLEQQMMTDDEIHSVQARFYGLENV